MTVGWSAEELERIRTAQELRISTSRADGTLRREVPVRPGWPPASCRPPGGVMAGLP
jgi:Mago binding